MLFLLPLSPVLGRARSLVPATEKCNLVYPAQNNFLFLQEPPFVEIKNKSLNLEDVAGKVMDGDLQGFLIDLIKELAKEAKFEYDLYLRSDTKYQTMIDELTRQVRYLVNEENNSK